MIWLGQLKPILTINQLNRLSNIFDNAGQVIFGIVVLSPVISGFDRMNWFVILSGVVGVLFCWFASLWVVRKGEKR